MRALITSLLLAFSLAVFSQEVPLIKVGDKDLGVAQLKVDVTVIGNRVTTTYDMKFYNPTKSILEGELIFPLGEGQSVSRFALDVNGKIREAVVVEKEQGRIAFEAVVRRRVDPALLEKGTGNNYKARIYPIPAKGYKQVILAYEEELRFSDDMHAFMLPQDFNYELELYDLGVHIYNQKLFPSLSVKGEKPIVLQKKGSDYHYSVKKENYAPNKDILINIPLDNDIKQYRNQDYLYAYKTLEAESIKKTKPKNIKLLWDVSYSMKDRDLEKEMVYLDTYFRHLSNVSLEVVMFSNRVHSSEGYQIINGNWDSLKTVLRTMEYDGGTSYHSLLNENEDFDEVLLFTDGLFTLSDLPKTSSIPLYVVNSSKKANHQGVSFLSNSNGGAYINLFNTSINDAFNKTMLKSLFFLGYTSSNKTLEVYPIPGSQVFKDFSLVAKGAQGDEDITLLFGYDEEVVEEVKLRVTPENQELKEVPVLWAKAKVDELQKESELNKDEIVLVGKQYGIITNHTSLIVLEDVYDYVKYDITPPDELLEQYLQIKKQYKNARLVSVENTESDDEDSSEAEVNEGEPISTPQQLTAPTGAQVTVTGTINDEGGLPLPGVNVIVDGTSNGTQTDFDGNYRINVSPGEILVFSYLSYKTLETTVRGTSPINIQMEPDASALSEVVVTGFAVKKEKKALGFAVSKIQAEEIADSPQSDLTRVLSGKAAGVQITSQNGLSGSANKVVIRGASSFSGDNNALYVIDGVPFSNDTNAAGSFVDGNMGSSRSFDIDPNNIERVDILKGLAATTLYGSEGRNGVILITTKTGANMRQGTSGSGSFSAEDREKREKQKRRRKLASERTVEEKGFTTKYLRELEAVSDKTQLYQAYLKQREEYAHMPAYFVDVYDYIKQYNMEKANRILSNIPEIDLDNYELLKVYAYKLEEKKNYSLAAFIYRQVLKLRPEDSQSYRDLALALQETGKFDEALELLTPLANESLYTGNERRKFDGMTTITTNEVRNIIHKDKAGYDPDQLPFKVVQNYDMDLRVVIDWNHNDTDIDLHIIDPNLEECSYSNTKTSTSGEISRDMTQGFGPEEFKQKFANKGAYYVKVKYYGDRYQKIENPTFLKITLFKNYGRDNQSKEVKVIRLSGRGKKHLIERIAVI